MAERLIQDTLGFVISELFARRMPDIVRKLEPVAEWLGEAAKPPPGVEVRTLDGSEYTGFAVIERNKLVVLLAVREQNEHASRPLSLGHRPEFSGAALPSSWDLEASYR
jgi:hypothetical protein